MDLLIRYDSHVIGIIEGVFWSDETGYGVFCPTSITDDDLTLRRIKDYIEFSEEWHERLRTQRPYLSAEWDTFRDVYASEKWDTAAPDGTISRISGPVLVQGEVTWGLPQVNEP